jgi:hypothetical protein
MEMSQIRKEGRLMEEMWKKLFDKWYPEHEEDASLESCFEAGFNAGWKAAKKTMYLKKAGPVLRLKTFLPTQAFLGPMLEDPNLNPITVFGLNRERIGVARGAKPTSEGGIIFDIELDDEEKFFELKRMLEEFNVPMPASMSTAPPPPDPPPPPPKRMIKEGQLPKEEDYKA